MDPVITRCGYRCDLCLAYKPNVAKDPSNQQKLSDGWYQYFGFRLPASRICCDGCMAEDPSLIDNDCPVRPCVIEKGLANCSECDQYECEKLIERIVVYEEVRKRIGVEIPEDDYLCFIKPYENKLRLEALRSAKVRKTHC